VSAKEASRPPLSREAASADPTQWNLLADLGRQQLALATESACAMFRGSEAMRKIQQQAAQQASEHHQAVAQKLRGPCEPTDLLAIQSDLLRFNLQGAALYWQQLGVATLKTQVEMMSCASQMRATESASEPKPALEA